MRTIETGGRFRRWVAWWLAERRRKRRAAALPPGPTVPNAPSGLTAETFLASIGLAWTDNANDETGFRVYRRLWAGSYSLVGATGSNQVWWQDFTAELGLIYVYRVVAYNAVGESAPSNEVYAEVTGE